ncbi:uncharacterized protein BDZ99DRAFT_507466 [Mytilinidion resinicola]|uniref:Glycosyltransferase family 69 protein n=1 Tax=Mytilinidion resinicola TaxID=574789 RepID=A0A6A6YXK6_9PEZI|nr:uncharacterized protein BDZ99DRAFT_507466 [Mytilinidion resinicola]KAF2813561.1 hypothetical protein BDZ99DRAFT_507466 [Mytilinidion resinicola]
MRPPVRSSRKFCGFFLCLLYATLAFAVTSFLNGILRPSYVSPPKYHRQLASQIQESLKSSRGNKHGKNVFIAANIVNEDLIRGSRGENLLQLVGIVGPENVFVSIYENDAGDRTRDALMDLRDKLPCNTSIVASDHMNLNSFPTVTIPATGEARTKRLLYLAEVRNRAILPLQSGPSITTWAASHPIFNSAASTRFDRVLFLNDIFKPVDAVQLLFSTNEGKYDAAFAIDFVAGITLYDTFVIQDTEGFTSRNDVLSQTDAVRVRSCWSGMAAFDTTVFQPIPPPTISPASQTSGQYKQDPVSGDTKISSLSLPGLTFHSITEPFFEESECCLLSADLEIRRAAIYNTLFPSSSPQSDARPLSTGVFIKPYIRVAYSSATWAWLPTTRRYERAFQFLQYLISKILMPEYNYRRTHAAGTMVGECIWVPASLGAEERRGLLRRWRGSNWMRGTLEVQRRVADVGGWCRRKRMFVMKGDLSEANQDGWGKNWEEVEPPGRKG